MIGSNINLNQIIHTSNIQNHVPSILGTQPNPIIHSHAHQLGSQQIIGNNTNPLAHIAPANQTKAATTQSHQTSFSGQIQPSSLQSSGIIGINPNSVSTNSSASNVIGGVATNQNMYGSFLSGLPTHLNIANLGLSNTQNYHIFNNFMKYLPSISSNACFYFIPLFNGTTVIDLLPQVHKNLKDIK